MIILGDLIVRNIEWLGIRTTNSQRRATRSFAVINEWTNTIQKPTFFPCVFGLSRNLLDFFIMTHPEYYYNTSTSVFVKRSELALTSIIDIFL